MGAGGITDYNIYIFIHPYAHSSSPYILALPSEFRPVHDNVYLYGIHFQMINKDVVSHKLVSDIFNLDTLVEKGTQDSLDSTKLECND